MVTFVSLFLWLMTGISEVEVAVDERVHSVEIFLNGDPIGVATGPAWTIDCDFGEVLRPHDLTAVALDATGGEIARAQQLVNLPRGDAEVEVVLESGGVEMPGRVRVITINRGQTPPLGVFVTFDGLQLAPDLDGTFPLPDHDPRMVHIITAEAHFADNVMARTDVTFGGTYGSRVATELTAVPIILDKGGPRRSEDFDGMLTARGRPVSVAAVEQSPAQVFLVRDHGSWPSLKRTGEAIDRTTLNLRNFRRLQVRGWDARAMAAIDSDANLFYLVVPNPSLSRGIVLYPIVAPFDMDEWSLPWLTTHVTNPGVAVSGQCLTEAIAVAGVRAAAGGGPRAVIIVLSGNPEDSSRYQPKAVREYLQSLRVPLYVWSTEKGHPNTVWGQSQSVPSDGKLRSASRRLQKSLRRQWIVWVEGRYLPSDIQVTEAARGFELAGRTLVNE